MDTVTEIQRLYPQIYLACHVEHVKARSNDAGISARDASILAHLSLTDYQRPRQLAGHLNISASTLSEALHHLASLGLVNHRVDADDERKVLFRLTESGLAAMKQASVLDSAKLQALVDKLSADEQRAVVTGLRLLATVKTAPDG